MKSEADLAETKLPIRCTMEFVKVCRFQSAKCYPKKKSEPGAKESAARFIKMAAIEKLQSLGLNKDYLKSIV